MNACSAVRRGVVLSAIAVLVASRSSPVGAQPAKVVASHPGKSATLAYTQFVLSNGLVVVVHESHAAPIVGVELWYHVGSKDDPPGRAGLAHFVEHVMGEGSASASPREFTDIVQRAGGVTNATTNEDRTQYYTVVPSNMLETVLWLEADRLGSQLSRVDQSGADVERPAIQHERGESYDTPVFGLANALTPATLFPVGHPYHTAPIGTTAEVQAATLEDLRAFARRFYWPNNAVLIIAGDVDAAQARAWVTKYFGGIAAGPKVTHSAASLPSLSAEKRVVLEDPRATSPRLRISWIAPDTRNADKPAMQMLAKVLGAGRGALLQQLLVTDRQLATSVRVGHYDLEESGIFEIEVAARPTASLTVIENIVDSVLANLKAHPVETDRLHRAVSDSAVASVVGLELTKARADILAEGVTYHGNPTALLDSRDAFAAVTPDDVRRVADRYLVAGRMVMSMIPVGKLDLISKPTLPFVNVTPK